MSNDLQTLQSQAQNQLLADIQTLVKNGGGARVEKPTDDILRDRWIKQAGQIVYGLGDFRRYRAGLWPPVNTLVIKREISRVLEAAKPEGIKPSNNLLSSVTELAKVELVVDDNIFDANPDYLVCKNGALHIPSRTLTDHKPELYATTGVNYDYDPQIVAPNWQRFIKSLSFTIGADVIDFLQEYFGYALTTDTSYEIALWLYGKPGGGKSTVATGCQTMLGDRAGLLGLSAIEKSRFALGNLAGKTLVVAAEQPAMFVQSTDVINALISGEPITVERKYQDPIEITPRAKILWAMNSLPRISDAGNGIFRRVKVVELPAIETGKQDVTLKDAIKSEGAGILNWALQGLAKLREREHFVIPDAVGAATDDFQNNNDVPALFVAERCVTGWDANNDPYRVYSQQLYDTYKAWCLENGHKPQSSTSVATEWKRLGFTKYRTGGRSAWSGIGLRV